MYKNIDLKYLKQVLMLMPGNLYWKDKEGHYLGCNYQQLQVAQVETLEEIIGKTDKDLYPNEIAFRIIQNDKEVIERKEEKTLEEVGVDAFGKQIIYLTKKNPLYDELGQVVGLVGIGVDITERKRLEENLVLAKEKAEAANHAKTEFIENMRHDIRTPLSGIVGCAHLIQIQPDIPKKAAAYVDDLVQSSDALLEFLNKILESIKVASGEIPLLRKKFSLYKILEQVVRLNKSMADVKKLHLYLNYDKDIPRYFLGDPIRIQRITLELVTNALKYTDKGEIKVNVRLIENKTRSGQFIIELRVSDTGMGIPKDKHHEIYTRFTRLTPSYKGINLGVGLGLSVVKQFIDELSGEIRIESEIGKGTTFICFIPLQESLSPPVDENEVEKTLAFAKGAHIVTKKTTRLSELQEIPVTTEGRVLVVEDQLIAAKVAQGTLLELNYQADIAPDGETALNLVEKNHYDLILMDIGLPDTDGCDVTRRIRLKQWKSNPSVPIVGLTAHVDEEKKKSCLANGMNAMYTKPLTPEKASGILNAFLSCSHTPILKEKRDESPDSSDLQSLPLLDKENAIKLIGSEKTFNELLMLLKTGLTEEIAELKQHHQDKDWQGIGKLAHKWKGGASYCGASRLEQVCEEIGIALRAESPEKIEILYQTLLQVAEETNQEARKIIAFD